MPCLFLTYPSARYTVLYLHGNADDLGRCRSFCGALREQFQVHVMAVEYPGYGICPGTYCSEQMVTENAVAALRFIRETLGQSFDSILVFGRSIGCGPALSLAVHYPVGGLILVAPMSSFLSLSRDYTGSLGPMVLTERFPNRERICHVRSSVMIIHGGKDSVIHSRHGKELFKLCKARKLLVMPPEMGHNDDLFADLNVLVVPMLRFFPLPDYSFEELKVPAWAFSRSMCADPHAAAYAETEEGVEVQNATGIFKIKRPLLASAGLLAMNPREEKVISHVVQLPHQRQERTASRSRLAAVQEPQKSPAVADLPPDSLVSAEEIPNEESLAIEESFSLEAL